MKSLDPEHSYRALQTRDKHFDGRLFFGITSTGIYCRPICPAKTAKFDNCKFFSTAAAAQEAGFRPCLVCRPELAPETPAPGDRSDAVSYALVLISEGYLDRDGSSVAKLAEHIGIAESELEESFREQIGASPSTAAQTRRVLFAKQLLHETGLSMSDIAIAAGFSGLQEFNGVFKELFRREPGDLRRKKRKQSLPETSCVVSLSIRYRPPYDWDHILSHLRARAIDGVEQIVDGTYRRTFSIEGHSGIVEVSNDPLRHRLEAKIRYSSVTSISPVVSRLRRLFDVHADIELINGHLSTDKQLAKLLERQPGLRVPGAWDGFELAVRAILGQQVTVRAAQQLAGKLVRLCHGPADDLRDDTLHCVFPSPAQLVAADLSAFGMPTARKGTLKGFASAVVADDAFFEPFGSLDETIRKLRMIPGIGEWTAQYIALRAFHMTDAFPATDVVILRGTVELGGDAMSPDQLVRRAEQWRPWRAYAAQHLWAAGGRKPQLNIDSEPAIHEGLLE
jgi:AraC family transcriptional regulator, regulatory protein of adaptative response / DNA-3-methyladenine glycosylase II